MAVPVAAVTVRLALAMDRPPAWFVTITAGLQLGTSEQLAAVCARKLTLAFMDSARIKSVADKNNTMKMEITSAASIKIEPACRRPPRPPASQRG